MGHIIIISILFVNSLLIKNSFTCQLVSSLVNLRYVHLLLCLLFTLSTSNLFTRKLVHSSTRSTKQFLKVLEDRAFSAVITTEVFALA